MLLSRPSVGSVILFKYENPSWIFWGLQNCEAILHVAKSPLHGLFNSFQVRKSLRGFFLDRRFARQISGVLSRPSMGSLIFIKYENPTP